MHSYRDPIRVLAVDDHPLVREGIVALVSSMADIELAGEAATGQEAVDRFRDLRPDVTLMDLRMPGMDGIDAIEGIRSEFPDAKIIVLTTYHGDSLARRALDAGARGYLLKSEVRRDLSEAVRSVHRGMRYIDSQMARQLAEHSAMEPLTSREVGILELAARGNSNKVIAGQLDLAEGTVKSHMQHILSKLQASDRTHAVSIAIRRGIIGF